MNASNEEAVERVPLSGTLPHPFLVTPYSITQQEVYPYYQTYPTPSFKSCAHTAVGASSKS